MLTVQFKLLISDTIKDLGRSVFSINNLCFSLIVNKWCYLSVNWGPPILFACATFF